MEGTCIPWSRQAAASPDGTAHIGWIEGLAAERTCTPTSALTDTQSLPSAYIQVLDVAVAADASGAAFYVWRRQRGGVVTVRGRRRGADGSLGPIVALSSTANTAYARHHAVGYAPGAVKLLGD